MEFLTDLPKSNAITYMLVVTDRLVKMCHLISFPKVPSATDKTSAFLNYTFRLHSFPNTIIEDSGTQFISKFWTAVCKDLSISLKISSPSHHQNNGLTEILFFLWI